MFMKYKDRGVEGHDARLFFNGLCNFHLKVTGVFVFQPAEFSGVEHEAGLGTALRSTPSVGLGSVECWAALTGDVCHKAGPLACCPVRSQHLLWVIAGR